MSATHLGSILVNKSNGLRGLKWFTVSIEGWGGRSGIREDGGEAVRGILNQRVRTLIMGMERKFYNEYRKQRLRDVAGRKSLASLLHAEFVSFDALTFRPKSFFFKLINKLLN